MSKSVLITGCSFGNMGFALAQSFHERGLTVFATAKSVAKMAALEALPNVVLLPLDVTSPADIAVAVEEVTRRTGGTLDYLVNNSSVSRHMPALNADIEEGKRLFDVNFWGALRMIQAFSPLLIASKGTVVNVGSIVGHLNGSYQSMYNASTAATNLFSETLRMELAPFGVKVVTVVSSPTDSKLPGAMSAPRAPPASTNLFRLGDRVVDMSAGNAGNGRMNLSAMAESTVHDILSGATGKIWTGNHTPAVRYLGLFLPTSVLVQPSPLRSKYM